MFEDVIKYWSDQIKRYHLYYFCPNFLLTEPLKISKALRDGDEIIWGAARITAVSTPGHTDGSRSFLADIKDGKIAFCGDLVYDKGQVLEVYSLQKSFGPLTDYHGFMFAWKEAIQSLRHLFQLGAKTFVPSHGK